MRGGVALAGKAVVLVCRTSLEEHKPYKVVKPPTGVLQIELYLLSLLTRHNWEPISRMIRITDLYVTSTNKYLFYFGKIGSIA